MTLREGRSADLVREMITAVTDAVVASLGSPRAAVQVVVTEVPGTHWAKGDVTLDEERAATTS